MKPSDKKATYDFSGGYKKHEVSGMSVGTEYQINIGVVSPSDPKKLTPKLSTKPVLKNPIKSDGKFKAEAEKMELWVTEKSDEPELHYSLEIVPTVPPATPVKLGSWVKTDVLKPGESQKFRIDGTKKKNRYMVYKHAGTSNLLKADGKNLEWLQIYRLEGSEGETPFEATNPGEKGNRQFHFMVVDSPIEG